MKKSIFVLIVLLAIFSLVPVLSARAGTLTSVTVSPTNIYGGYTANYTVSFVTASTTEIQSQIRLIFPSGFNVAGATATTTGLASSTGASEIATSTVALQEVTLWLADGDITPIGETIEVTALNIVSPTAGGVFTLGVETRTLADGEIDTASSTAFSIFGGKVGGTPLYSDTIPPTSKITSPTDGLTISVGEKYTIQGTAQDQGGSTVQKVEVSLDGGQNWSMTEIKSALANVFSWEYVWQNPTKGEYVIKARATDAVGNIESPLTGKKVTVSVPVPPTPVPEKPITEMTVQELEAKIVEVQQKIVDILTQLIQLFQQQIQALLAK